MAGLGALTSEAVDAATAKVALKKLYDVFQVLDEQAPAELAADMKLLADLSKRQYDIMARNGFDFDKVGADAEFPALSKDASAPAAKQAGEHLTAYATATCGLDLEALTSTPTTPGG